MLLQHVTTRWLNVKGRESIPPFLSFCCKYRIQYTKERRNLCRQLREWAINEEKVWLDHGSSKFVDYHDLLLLFPKK